MKRAALLLLAALWWSACTGEETGGELYEVEYTEERDACDDRNPLRNALATDLPCSPDGIRLPVMSRIVGMTSINPIASA